MAAIFEWQIDAVLEAYKRSGSISKAAQEVGVHRITAARILRGEQIATKPAFIVRPGGAPLRPAQTDEPTDESEDPAVADHDALIAALRKKPATLDELAGRFQSTRGAILDAIDAAKEEGLLIHEAGGRYSVESAMQSAVDSREPTIYYSRPDNTYVFGASSDQHLGSKYERVDVLNMLYDRFAELGVDRVLNAGNWIEGEAKFNRFDVAVHGMESQLEYLVEHYPIRSGLVTYAVAGDDHEGWYCQREGIDIGGAAQRKMREAGREDWVDLGYMEASIRLVNANSGAESSLFLCHPGGGSAYALSYSIQKIVESYDGGEKPSVGIYGHYHKLWSGNIRNVFVVQSGCTQDQTPFMRKKRLEAHVGGYVVELRQDPETGAIVEMSARLLRYFNKGYYNHQWSKSGAVVHPRRAQ